MDGSGRDEAKATTGNRSSNEDIELELSLSISRRSNKESTKRAIVVQRHEGKRKWEEDHSLPEECRLKLGMHAPQGYSDGWGYRLWNKPNLIAVQEAIGSKRNTIPEKCFSGETATVLGKPSGSTPCISSAGLCSGSSSSIGGWKKTPFEEEESLEENESEKTNLSSNASSSTPVVADSKIEKARSSTSNPAPLKRHHSLVKPPKPKVLKIDATPCVSMKGNGPNGRTINGILHSYKETEVTIICDCHGVSFSAEEFVKHAGGTDLSNALKQITVSFSC